MMYKSSDVKHKIKNGIKDEFWYTTLVVLSAGILDECKPVKCKFYINEKGNIDCDDFKVGFLFEGRYFDTEEEAIDYYNYMVYYNIKLQETDKDVKEELKDKFINTSYLMEKMIRGD